MEFLVNDTLQEIFSNLDQESLVNASLVCQRWLCIIRGSSFLMKKFECIIAIQPNNFKIKSVFKSGKYRNLTLTLEENVADFPPAVIKKLTAQSGCLRTATFVNFDRLNAIQTLSMLRNITNLIISNYRHENDVLGTIVLPNLRHLELIDSMSFAEVIGSQTLRILKIYGVYDNRIEIKDANIDLKSKLNNFLSKCKHLKDLTLSNIQFRNPYLSSVLVDFSLEALTIEDFNFDEENLIEFLEKQKKTLKKLAILSSLPKSFISAIIFSQLSLDELEIDVGIIPSTFNPLRVNKTIKKLTIRSTMGQAIPHVQRHFNVVYPVDLQPQPADPQVATEKIISTCNIVEDFKILELAFDSLLQHLNETLLNLKVLKLQTIPKFVSPTIEFEKLEVIEIDKLSTQLDIENCQFLVLYSPNLQTLKVNFMESELFTSKFFIQIVTWSKNLREIHIGTRCRFSLDMINAVRLIKAQGHPLESISFSCCFMDNKIAYDVNDIFMDGLKLNFHQNSNLFFSFLINETRLGQIKREMDEKQANLEQQGKLKDFRDDQIKKYLKAGFLKR